MPKYEYVEGSEAFANFERFAKTALQSPRPKAKKRPKKAALKPKPKPDRD
jgi:hypothetical protein